MKKTLLILSATLISLMLLACEKKSGEVIQKDVKAEAETIAYHGEIGPDSHGWLIIADYTKKGDDVITATFDCMLINKHEYVVDDGLDYAIGDMKTDLSKAGKYNLKLAGATLDWHEQIAEVEKYFIENDGWEGIKFDDSGHDVDSMTSATIHFSEFKDAADAAKPADEAVFTFAKEGPRDSHGWEPFVIYQKEGDKIVSAAIDCFLGDPAEYIEEGLDAELGDLKTDLSREGIYDMKVGGAKMDWHEQAEAVAAYLIENQSFDSVKFDDCGHDVDGVTSASIHFEEFAVLF